MVPERETSLPQRPNALRLGLCCQFVRQPIKFRVTTATAMLRLPRPAQLERLAELCRANAEALLAALQFCAGHGIGAFRINSQILPVKTHPEAGYEMNELPGGAEIIARLRECGQFAGSNNLRLSFHPGQFVVLNSPNPMTLASSLAELSAPWRAAGRAITAARWPEAQRLRPTLSTSPLGSEPSDY
ncbi:MAG: hypothetical protein IPM84_12805 [Anaerolineae bacterium]|nr:hypothetical protein [Anaerolineae bacterium]